MEQSLRDGLLTEQRNEITGHVIYKDLSSIVKDENNRSILMRISDDEMKHYERLKSLTGEDVGSNRFTLILFRMIARLLGITFAVKLLERLEEKSQNAYGNLADEMPLLKEILEDEDRHEQELISMIDEEHLHYMGSVVLGLNDALVELTGALAGYTFAFQNARLIALTGLIMGFSASLSMSASEYLSAKQEADKSDRAVKSAAYTGLAYVFTVVLLILPYLLLSNPFISLSISLIIALLVILVFNYYISVTKDTEFGKRFAEMSLISLGVAGLSFCLGVIVKQFFNIEI